MGHTISFDTLAHRLLDELDARHDELLAELDSLNARVDAVLSQYVTVQPDSGPDSGPDAVAETLEDDD